LHSPLSQQPPINSATLLSASFVILSENIICTHLRLRSIPHLSLVYGDSGFLQLWFLKGRIIIALVLDAKKEPAKMLTGDMSKSLP